MESSEAGWGAGRAGGVSSGGEHLQKVSMPAVFSFPLRGLDLPGRSCRKKDWGSVKEALPNRIASNSVLGTEQELDECLGW